MNRISLAHLSDLHLPLAEERPRLRALIGKRVFSWLSWRRHRRFVHRAEVLAQVMADVRSSAPAHVMVTGDLVNLGLPDEFARARDWLQTQGGPDALTVVPGNHDALVPVAWAQGQGLWSPWMGAAADEASFPFVRRIGEVALVGVSSAVPTGLFQASGRIGEAQLRRLEMSLQTLGKEGIFRIVMVHHPINDEVVSRRKALKDRAALRAVLARAGAELVLHGHSHEPAVDTVPGPCGPIPVVSAPSASASPDVTGPPGGWSLIELTSTNRSWGLTVSLRSLGRDGRFATIEHFEREIPRPSRVE